jgi:hypothetical protein
MFCKHVLAVVGGAIYNADGMYNNAGEPIELE